MGSNNKKRKSLSGQMVHQFLLVFCLLAFIVSSGCAYIPTFPTTITYPRDKKANDKLKNVNEPKNLFVFLDGTANDPILETNVHRLYTVIAHSGAPLTQSIYIDGVGTQNSFLTLTGMILGLGMEERILIGYRFLALNYRPGDKIFIFGFSRGAHQARALAGLLAYSGLPKNFPHEDKEKEQLNISNEIIELTKEESDSKYMEFWNKWTSQELPPLAQKIQDHEKLKINGNPMEVQPVEVTFLGVWDTVPGSWFKEYGECKEMPDDGEEGDRYKSDSYPPFKHIAHAISIDEKRSKFKHIRICPTMHARTKIDEMWFPGAHADVGGGYEDSDELPGLSYNWMTKLLAKSYAFGDRILPQDNANAQGLAHWSFGDFPANLGSDCEDREVPPGAIHHSSYEARELAGLVRIRIDGKEKEFDYPSQPSCTDE